jgi:hypothetical protein
MKLMSYSAKWLLLSAVVCTALICNGCSGPVVGTETLNTEGVVLGSASAPFVVEFGTVAGDSSNSRTVTLRNPSGKPIRVDSFSASCECTSVSGLPVEVPLNGKQEITVTSDFSKEPGFSGGLGITVELKSGDAPLGTIEVRCDVSKTVNESFDPNEKSVLNGTSP